MLRRSEVLTRFDEFIVGAKYDPTMRGHCMAQSAVSAKSELNPRRALRIAPPCTTPPREPSRCLAVSPPFGMRKYDGEVPRRVRWLRSHLPGMSPPADPGSDLGG